MKAVITRASAVVNQKTNKHMLTVSGMVTEGVHKGEDFSVYHHPRSLTDAQRQATSIFLSACPLDKEHWGHEDLHIACNVACTESTEGDDTFEDWSFISPAKADKAVIDGLYGDDTPADEPAE